MAARQESYPKKIDLSALQRAEIQQAKPGPQSPQLERDAASAMSHTADWRPALGGRPEGYRHEDRKRELMVSSEGVERGQGTGFSEGQRGG
jgi:hypothetical protein